MTIKVSTAAKLNLILNCVGKMQDSGMHELEMIMQSADLSDVVSVTVEDIQGDISVDCDGVESNNNIALKAAEEYYKRLGRQYKTAICIEKRIPICGGLGGGSADAAAVLYCLNKKFDLLDVRQLNDLALTIGADVPFALVGGTAAAFGAGERINSLEPMPSYYAVIAILGEKPSTGEMFRRLDLTGNTVKTDINRAAELINSHRYDEAAAFFKNSFSVLWQGDTLDSVCAVMNQHNALCTSLSGSGPSYFGLFKDEADATRCCNELCPVIKAFKCRLCEKSITEIE